MKYFRIDAAGMGVLASCYYWIYTFMQVPAGILIDKASSRIIATVSAVTCASGVLIFIATSNCYIAGIGQMLLGFGSSFAFLLTLKVVTSWFPSKEVPVKTSYTMAIGCGGPIVGGLLVSGLVKDFEWISIMRIFAISGLFLAVFLWFVVRDNNTTTDKHKSMPIMESLKIIMTSRQVWILALFTMMQYAPLSAMGDLWGVSFLKKAYNIDATVASLANNMLYAGIVVGSPAFAYLAVFLDSYKKPILLGISTATICMSVVIFCTGLPLEAVFGLLFLAGFSTGAMLAFPLGMMMYPQSISATVSGFINMASMFSGIILMPLIGVLIDWSWDGTMVTGIKSYNVNDYRVGLSAVVIFLLLGVLLAFGIKDRSPNENRPK
jgi:MFS family permease